MAAFYLPKVEAVFLHIPKTAGMSIRRGFFESKYEGPVQGYVPEEWMQYFKFAFVRNPFDRLVSAWKMFTAGVEESVWECPGGTRPDLTLSGFLQIASDDSIRYDGVRDEFEVELRHHSLPQTHPFYCLADADFVGRFEQLETDFQLICEQLGLTNAKLPHWNKTKRRDYREYFDEESRKLAEEFFAEDLKQLGYTF